jgi:hypothetical protein
MNLARVASNMSMATRQGVTRQAVARVASNMVTRQAIDGDPTGDQGRIQIKDGLEEAELAATD